MNTPKHTPGPWNISTRDADGFDHVADKNGNWICQLWSKHEEPFKPIEETRANAKLISAAPELLHALQSITGIEAFIQDPKMVELFQSKVYPSIQKATE